MALRAAHLRPRARRTRGSPEAFRPDFYPPDLGLDLDFDVEFTVWRQPLTNRERRKALKTRRQAGVSVEVLFRRDIDQLARRWSSDRLAEAASTHV